MTQRCAIRRRDLSPSVKLMLRNADRRAARDQRDLRRDHRHPGVPGAVRPGPHHGHRLVVADIVLLNMA